MKIFKKLLCFGLGTVVINSTCHMEAKALFGTTHFNICKKIIEKIDQTLSESEQAAFLSGSVYADIGRFKFDKETGIESDSAKFVNEMKKFAKTSEEQWFVRGFEAHVLQDTVTGKFLNETLGRKSSCYSEYIMDCSLLDSYFLKKNGSLYNNFLDKFNFEQIIQGWDIKDLSKATCVNENQIQSFVTLALNKYSNCPSKNELVMYDNLIKQTYKSFGFEISLDEIREQAANIVGVFIVTSNFAAKREISEDLASKIESKSDELANLCITNINFN